MHIMRFLKKIYPGDGPVFMDKCYKTIQKSCLHGSDTWLRTMVDTSELLMLEGKEHIDANIPAFLKIKCFTNNPFKL
jgi:hypothetical protein